MNDTATSPCVSIVIPCHDAGPWIPSAIESALNQTWPHIEVIVIDDGSTDDSAEKIATFGEAIRFERIPHAGGSAARNRGLALAHGEYIQFLDADDMLHEEKVTRSMAQRDRADIVFCDYQVMANGRASRARTHLPVYDGGDPIPLALTHRMGISSPLHPAHLLREVGGFDETLPCAQEYDLNLRLACTGTSFCHLPQVLYSVRRLPGSVSSDYVRVLDQYEGILRRGYGILRERGALTDARARAFAETMARAARHYVLEDEIAGAHRYFEEAARMHPGAGLTAFSPIYRLAYRTLGPLHAERLVNLKRRIRRQRHGTV